MAKTQTLSLGEHWNSFISSQVSNGRYASASEVVREALRLLEEKGAQSSLHQLRQALAEGERSGDAGEFNPQHILDDALSEHYGKSR